MKKILFVMLIALFSVATMSAQTKKKTHTRGKVYEVVEQMPVFPGGQQALMTYLKDNVKYPKDMIDKGAQGRVVVSFVIDKEGNVTDVKVAYSVSKQFDEEAMRVIRAMPKWVPGKQKGKNVSVRYNIPVSFRLK